MAAEEQGQTAVAAADLPQGYSKKALAELIELARQGVESEYGTVYLPDIFKEKLARECRFLAKEYGAQVAYEEMQRRILEFIRVRLAVR
jgi:1,4-dihydroxy-2-naphthoyl-CoA synthase